MVFQKIFILVMIPYLLADDERTGIDPNLFLPETLPGKDERGGIDPNLPERRVPDDSEPQQQPNDKLLHRLIGSEVEDGSYASNGKGQVQFSEELSCDFQQACCWKNAKPPSTMEWILASGNSEPNKVQQTFGVSSNLAEKYLVVATENAVSSSDSAVFLSCSIPCTNEPIKVTLKHWSSPNVVTQVCTKASDSDAISNCVALSPKETPGPSIVSLPSGQNIQLAIVAQNFVNPDSIAVIDDLKVEFTPCSSSTVSQQTVTTLTTVPTLQVISDQECKLDCNFEQGNMCSYTDKSSATSKFSVAREHYRNPHTGIPKKASTSSYAASYMKPKDEVLLESSSISLDQNRILQLDYYKATQDVTLDVCVDNLQSCMLQVGKNARISDYKVWHTASIPVPKGTHKVIFHAKNIGKNEGAVGLDNIKLLLNNNTPACQTNQPIKRKHKIVRV